MAAPLGFFPPPLPLCLPCLATPDPKPAAPNRTTSSECWSWCRLRKPRDCAGHGRPRRPNAAGQQAKRDGRCTIARSLLGEERRLPCGLLPSQVSDLLDREITPNDYEMLLQLDESIPKPTASRAAVERLPSASEADFIGETCTVCLHAFELRDAVARLHCKHLFHHDCISKWLLERCRLCPLCGDEQPHDHTHPHA
mmetsp:Transcript_28750/g.72783  ORF Transcript_28750/g.72783 Transcript_28750/m.72783 type:complete len:197 (-) Transcript_28750:272-862(-)